MRDPIIKCIAKRLAKLAEKPVSRLEDLQLVSYRRKQRYKPHSDALSDPDATEREKTLLLYLTDNDPQCGGATVFTRLKTALGEPLRVSPKRGRALLWNNLLTDGSPNEATEHAGEPLMCNKEKLAVNAWWHTPKPVRKM